ncbi:MAG: insulinase family protein [Alphaproteobacteria bacterium]|nr:insulinase family protein [Alphaproteobacteria bacterium]
MTAYSRFIANLTILTLGVLVFAAVTPARAVEIQRVVSPGGVEAWLVEDRTLPIIALRFSMTGGTATDPWGKEGLANMASALLDEGAGDLDSQTFRRRLEDNSISLSFSASRDTFSGSLRSLTRNRDEAFDLFHLAMTEPRFDDEAVERIRAQILTGIAGRKNNPRSIANRTFWSANFPKHPYGRRSGGTVESVNALTQTDLKAFVSRRIARGDMVIGVAGDIGAAELAPLLDSTFGDLPERAEAFSIGPGEPAALGEVFVVEQDVPQSTIVFGHRGLPRDDPDYYAAYILNHVLGGGGFTSRLYEEIREKRGLAYSVSSYLQPLDHAALWLGGAATENSAVGQSLDVIRAEWARLRDTPITQERLDAARDNITGSFALRFNNTGAIAGMLVAVQRQDLGIEYIDERSKFFEAVTIDDVNRIAKKLLDPDALTIVVVGKPEGVKPTKQPDEAG